MHLPVALRSLRRLLVLVVPLLAALLSVSLPSSCHAVAAEEADVHVPQGLWEAFTKARHAIEDAGTDVSTINHRNDQHIRFSADGIEVRSLRTTEDWRWRLRLTGYGSEDQMQPVAAAQTHIDGTRITYQRGPITEWYINRPVGLEQGFTLEQPPHPDTDQLILELAVEGGLSGQWQEPHQSLAFYTSEGQYALSYSKLEVSDANGRSLPAHLGLQGTRLAIYVDAEQATWPIYVDPLVTNEQKVVPPQGDGEGAAGDNFGNSVAIDGDTALIGAVGYGASSGAAYVFTRSGSSWSKQAKLFTSDLGEWDSFGTSVALDGDTALIGASEDSDNGYSSGSAYVFTRNGNSWSEQAKLFASDWAEWDSFGTSVALEGDTALIGAPGWYIGGRAGSAYMFTRNGDSWSEQTKLLASDLGEWDSFGTSVALDGDTALIGAAGSGSAYVFTRNDSSWIEQTKLFASDLGEWDSFGTSVALDGDTALIGAAGSGSAYVFTRSGSSWIEQTKLFASDGEELDDFGTSVALEGDTALIGAPRKYIEGKSGSAYIYTRSGSSWRQYAKLLANDGEDRDGFGTSVALDGDTALIGASGDNDNGYNSGSAYVFTRSGISWSEQDKLLLVGNGAEAKRFGTSVAIDGDTALIGASDEKSFEGAAYIFTRNGSSWSKQAKLLASDGAGWWKLGTSVALDGDTALIGAPGVISAYVFTRNSGSWSEQARFFASDWAEREWDHFGISVALDGDTALIGAAGAISAYVFTRSGNGWSEQARLFASDWADYDGSWTSVALDGDTALIGAMEDDGYSGAAYVFTRSGSSWSKQAKLFASDWAEWDNFGTSVALDSDTVLIGASGDEGYSGSAYVFTRSGSSWIEQTKLFASDGEELDDFGTSVALDGDTALIGAAGSGSAYVFTRNDSSWIEQTKLFASDGEEWDDFGTSVALEGDTALIGAPHNDCDVIPGCGAAYFMALDGIGYAIQTQASPTEGGTVICNPNPVDHDSNSICTPTANPGYTFSTWSGDCSGSDLSCTLSTVTSPKSVTAYFSDSLSPGDCSSEAFTLRTAVSSGIQTYRSETSISVTGTVQVAQDAELVLSAPRIDFAPGFQVERGGQLRATAATVTCTASRNATLKPSTSIADSVAIEALETPIEPVLFTSASALPAWVRDQLTQLGIDPAQLGNGVLDANAHWLLIETTQALQTSDQNDASDLYRLDLISNQLQLISATEQGQAGNGPSRYPAADATGERIVFHSEADNLVPNDTNNVSDLFLRDLALEQTIRLTDAEQSSKNPSLDAIGERLVYDQATQAGPRQVIGQALAGGTAVEVLSLSTNDSGLQVDNHHPAISADGRFIAYLEHSAISDEANPGCQVHLYDRDTEVYHRQPCPDALASASASEEASVRGVFSEGAQSLEWYLTGVAEPIRLSNPLALGTATQDDARR